MRNLIIRKFCSLKINIFTVVIRNKDIKECFKFCTFLFYGIKRWNVFWHIQITCNIKNSKPCFYASRFPYFYVKREKEKMLIFCHQQFFILQKYIQYYFVAFYSFFSWTWYIYFLSCTPEDECKSLVVNSLY